MKTGGRVEGPGLSAQHRGRDRQRDLGAHTADEYIVAASLRSRAEVALAITAAVLSG